MGDKWFISETSFHSFDASDCYWNQLKYWKKAYKPYIGRHIKLNVPTTWNIIISLKKIARGLHNNKWMLAYQMTLDVWNLGNKNFNEFFLSGWFIVTTTCMKLKKNGKCSNTEMSRANAILSEDQCNICSFCSRSTCLQRELKLCAVDIFLSLYYRLAYFRCVHWRRHANSWSQWWRKSMIHINLRLYVYRFLTSWFHKILSER